MLPANLRPFVPGAPAETPPEAPKTPSQSGGILGMAESAVSGVKNFVGGLFGGKKTAPAPVSGSGTVPENLAEFLPKTTQKSSPKPVLNKNSSKTPKNDQKVPSVSSVHPNVPDNLKGFVPVDTANPNPLGDMFLPKMTTDSSTSETPGAVNPGVDLANIGKDLAQAIPRTAAQIGISLGQAAIAHGKFVKGFAENLLAGKPGAPVKTDNSIAESVTPKGPLTYLLGDQPIEGLSNDVANLEQGIKSSPFAKKHGFDKYALPLAFSTILGGESLNFVPFGGSEKGLIDALALANTPEAAAIRLRQAGFSEALAHDLAPKFAALTDKNEIKDALKTAIGLKNAETHAESLAGMSGRATSPLKGDAAAAKDAITHSEAFNVQDSITSGELNRDAYYAKGDTLKPEIARGRIDDIAQKLDAYKPGLGAEFKSGIDETAVTMKGNVPEDLVTKAHDLIDKNPSGSTLGDLADAYRNVGKSSVEGFSAAHEALSNILTEMELSKPGERLFVPSKTGGGSEVKGVSSTFFPSWVPSNLRDSKLFQKVLGGLDLDHLTYPPATAPKQRELYDAIFNELDHRLGMDTSSIRATIKSNGTKTLTGSQGEIDLGARGGAAGETAVVRAPSGGAAAGSVEGVAPALPPSVRSIGDILNGSDWLAEKEKEFAGMEKPSLEGIPEGNFDESTQAGALLEAHEGDIKTGAFKGWNPKTVAVFQDWLNARKADTLQVVSAITRTRFEPLRQDGVDAILRFEGFELKDGQIVSRAEGPERGGLYADVQRTNDDFFKRETAAGVDVKYRQNYLRLYLKDPKTGQQFVDGIPLEGRTASTGRKPAFALPREFKTYSEAIAAGYEPIYPTIPDILAQRAAESERAISNAHFFDYMVKTGNAVPASLVTESAGRGGFASFDPDRFPTRTVAYQGKVYTGVFKGPAPVVEKVNQYLREPLTTFERGLEKVANGVGAVKNVALSIGIPKTGFSIHYWNIGARDAMADIALGAKSAPREIGKFLSYGADPSLATKYVRDNLDNALPLLRAGMKFSSEEHDLAALDLFHDLPEGVAGKVGTVGQRVSHMLHNAFAANVFSKIIPARKLYNGLRMVEFLKGKGVAEEEAYRIAALKMNELYGGINWEQLGRSKLTQNILRVLLIAPDFAETNVRLGIGAARGLGSLIRPVTSVTGGEAAYYRNFALAFVGTYVAANLINYEQTGRWLYQNDPLHQLSIAAGKDANGKTRYLNVFGTGTDWARIPLQVAAAVRTNNIADFVAIVRNRLSIPVASAFSLIMNTDWSGQRIYGPDIYGNPQSMQKQLFNILNNTVGSALPGSVQEAANLATGKVTPEQALTQGLALPVSYVNEKPNATTIKALKASAAEGIANGDYSLYYELVKTGAIPPRSRASFIRQALTGAKTARQTRASAKTKAKTTATEAKLEAAGFTKNSQ